MGSATRHRQAFLQANPSCAFCGGGVHATTIEHCPPRAMFQFRRWPEGFEFPACAVCNQGTDDHDLIVALLARMDPFQNKGNLDGKGFGLMRMVNKQFPGLFEKMMPSTSEARQHNRELGIQPLPGQTHQEASNAIKVPQEFHDAVCVFARKLAKGVYYRETRIVFPNNGCLLSNWFSNEHLAREGKYPVFEVLKNLSGDAPQLKRADKLLNDQFEYRYSLSPDKTISVLQARFGNSFGLAVFGSTIPDHLEAIVRRLRDESGHDGPFAVLQSQSLKTSV